MWQVNRPKVFLLVTISFGFYLIFIWPPNPLFDVPYAALIESSEGELLDASIASDEQWRFPPLDSLPVKFKVASRLFEDEYFYYHFGINPFSLMRANYQNIRHRKIVSGGSTISMQTIRMALGNKPRTYSQKFKEVLLSIKLELQFSKESIFKAYANHAPFGGNIVGLHAASWRYYLRPPHKLSWGEIATLAVLPNDPKSIFPGKNQHQLRLKRNRLLDKICRKGYFDKNDLILYKSEPLPTKIAPLPNHAPHLLQRAINENQTEKKITSSLDYKLQKKANQIVKQYNSKLSLSEINNAAAIIIEIKSGDVKAYIGNTATEINHAKYVDIITAPRSPGSLLKPFLYAAAIDDGIILPEQLINDTPLYYNGFIPKNFDKKFRGVVPAARALSSSLNVPFVNLLSLFSYEKFYDLLKKIGYKNFKKKPEHYGLSLILGTAESSLWEISSLYAGMARAYQAYFQRPLNAGYSDSDYRPNNYVKTNSPRDKHSSQNSYGAFSVFAIESTFKAMQKLERPEQEIGWESFVSEKSIAWKTGTSYGYKDAWAIGLNNKYLVGVWVGNADGEARPDLIGIRAAAPLMFSLFRQLDGGDILEKTSMGDAEKICAKSGMLAKKICPQIINQKLTNEILKKSKKCFYHKSINLNQERTHQVNSDCYKIHQIHSKNYLVLTPIQAWYYEKYHPNYEKPPPLLSNCRDESETPKLQLLYPHKNAKIYIPKEQSGERGRVVFRAAHQNRFSKIFWHINDSLIAITEENHQVDLVIPKGKHSLVLIDDFGIEIQRIFSVTN